MNTQSQMKQATKLTFNNMQQVSEKIFGIELQRCGRSFQLVKEGELLGGQHAQWALKDIRNLYQQFLDHPEVVDMLSTELQAALGHDKAKNQKARACASRIGVLLVRERGGFYMFKDGVQLGNYCDELWTADDVIDYCQKFEAGLVDGVFRF